MYNYTCYYLGHNSCYLTRDICQETSAVDKHFFVPQQLYTSNRQVSVETRIIHHHAFLKLPQASLDNRQSVQSWPYNSHGHTIYFVGAIVQLSIAVAR